MVAGPTIGSLVVTRGTQCLYDEALKDDVPNSLDILHTATGGTPIVLLGRGTVIQDWIDQNCGDGASHATNFRVTTTIYLGSAEERELFGFGSQLSRRFSTLVDLCGVSTTEYEAS